MTDDTIGTDNIYPINKPKYPDLSGSPEEVWNQCLETDEEGNNIHVFGPYEYSVFVTIPLRWVLPLDDDADDDSYWNKIWNWYDNGGDGDVAAYLATKDISSFNPKKPPTRTEAFWAIVNSNMAPEQGELADVLDALDNPKVVTLKQIVDKADHFGDLKPWLEDRHNRRTIPHRMETCGYVPVRNPYAKDDRAGLKNLHRTISGVSA